MNAPFLRVGLVLAAISFEALAQIALKLAADERFSIRANGRTRNRFALIGAGLGCYVIEIGFWTVALRGRDVSALYPMGSLSFVAVALLSWLWLKERVTGRRWIGIALILAGTIIIGGNS